MLFTNGKKTDIVAAVRSNSEAFLFLFLTVLFLLPIWSFQYFPSQDGPSHIANAHTFLEYFNPAYPVFSDYLFINYSATPTWFSHLLLTGLMSHLSPLVAEKVLLSIYVILFPIAVRYALVSVNPKAGFLSLLAFPFIYNYLLHMGFYSFCYSLIMFFFVLGYWIRYKDSFTFQRAFVFSLLSLLLYLFHISVWSWTFFAITILVLWFSYLDINQQYKNGKINWQNQWQLFKSRAMVPLLSCIPTLILILAFLYDKQFVKLDVEIDYMSRLIKLFAMYSLVSFDIWESVFSIVLSLSVGGLSVYLVINKILQRRLNKWDGLLIVAVAYTILYLFSPETIIVTPNGMHGGGYIEHRLNLFPFFALILWLVSQNIIPVIKKALIGISLIVSLSMLGLHSFKYHELNTIIEDYMSGSELIEPNSTVLALTFSPHGPEINNKLASKRVLLFMHTVEYIATKRHSVSFTNYEANHGYFPLVYREQYNPYQHIALNETDIELPIEAELEFQTYEERTGGKLDYILIWGLEEEHLSQKNVQSTLAQLEVDYSEIHHSPMGLMTIYKRIRK